MLETTYSDYIYINNNQEILVTQNAPIIQQGEVTSVADHAQVTTAQSIPNIEHDEVITTQQTTGPGMVATTRLTTELEEVTTTRLTTKPAEVTTTRLTTELEEVTTTRLTTEPDEVATTWLTTQPEEVTTTRLTTKPAEKTTEAEYAIAEYAMLDINLDG